MIIENEADLQDWSEIALEGPVARYLTAAMLEEPRPQFGEEWASHLDNHARWVLAHARWRLDEQGVPGVRVSLYGRGVRVQDEQGIDVFVKDFYEFDRLIDSLTKND